MYMHHKCLHYMYEPMLTSTIHGASCSCLSLRCRLEGEAISPLTPLNDNRAGDHGAPGTVQWADVYSTSAAGGTVMDTSCSQGRQSIKYKARISYTCAGIIVVLFLLTQQNE